MDALLLVTFGVACAAFGVLARMRWDARQSRRTHLQAVLDDYTPADKTTGSHAA
jgi:hypothetical protein